jgi:hypothetical protein
MGELRSSRKNQRRRNEPAFTELRFDDDGSDLLSATRVANSPATRQGRVTSSRDTRTETA